MLKKTFPFLILALSLILHGSCGETENKEASENVRTTAGEEEHASYTSETVALKNQGDSIVLNESHHIDDPIDNDYLRERLQPIRVNFKRINSIDSWSSITRKELWESTEGGEAIFYYTNRKLEKITLRHFGETFKYLAEFYFLEKRLSFVLERSHRYNRPFYYDVLDMEANGDNQAHDPELSEIVETRSYFENEKMIHQIHSQDCGAPFDDDYLLDEEKRLLEIVRKLRNK